MTSFWDSGTANSPSRRIFYDAATPIEANRFVHQFSHYIDSSSYMRPRQQTKKHYLKSALFHPDTTYAYIRTDAHGSLQPVYKGSFKVLKKYAKCFVIDTKRGFDNVSIDRLKNAQISFESVNRVTPDTNISAAFPSTTIDTQTHFSPIPPENTTSQQDVDFRSQPLHGPM